MLFYCGSRQASSNLTTFQLNYIYYQPSQDLRSLHRLCSLKRRRDHGYDHGNGDHHDALQISN